MVHKAIHITESIRHIKGHRLKTERIPAGGGFKPQTQGTCSCGWASVQDNREEVRASYRQHIADLTKIEPNDLHKEFAQPQPRNDKGGFDW